MKNKKKEFSLKNFEDREAEDSDNEKEVKEQNENKKLENNFDSKENDKGEHQISNIEGKEAKSIEEIINHRNLHFKDDLEEDEKFIKNLINKKNERKMEIRKAKNIEKKNKLVINYISTKIQEDKKDDDIINFCAFKSNNQNNNENENNCKDINKDDKDNEITSTNNEGFEEELNKLIEINTKNKIKKFENNINNINRNLEKVIKEDNEILKNVQILNASDRKEEKANKQTYKIKRFIPLVKKRVMQKNSFNSMLNNIKKDKSNFSTTISSAQIN